MKVCKVPSGIAVGKEFYSYEGASFTDGTSAVEAHTWVVRSIRKKNSFIRLGAVSLSSSAKQIVSVGIVSKVKGLTWKSNDWASYIPKTHRRDFDKAGNLPQGIYTTRLQAIIWAVKHTEKQLERCKLYLALQTRKADILDAQMELDDYERELRLLKLREARIRKRGK